MQSESVVTIVRVLTSRNVTKALLVLSLAVSCKLVSGQTSGYPLFDSPKTQGQTAPLVDIQTLPEFPSAESASQDASALLQPGIRVSNISRLGDSPGSYRPTLANAKTANPKIELEQSTRSQAETGAKTLEDSIRNFSNEFELAYAGILPVSPLKETQGRSTPPTNPPLRQASLTQVPLHGQRSDFGQVPLGVQAKSSRPYELAIVSLPPQPQIQLASAHRDDGAAPNENVVNGSFAPKIPANNTGPKNAAPYPRWSNSDAKQDFLGAAESENSSNIWWKQQVLQSIHSPNSRQEVDTNGLAYKTLQNSPRILALSQTPMIRDLQVIEADSSFDATSFVQSQFQDRVDPVGDNLSITSDGSDFLQDHIWSGEFGLRKKTRTGMTYEVGQTLGFKNSNSSFFDPQDQGTATLALNVTQPLLRGRGRYVNESQILIAQSTGGAAWNSFASELQDEIQKTVKAYWRLYFDRSVYLQKRRNVERGEKILRTLEGRAGLDSLPSQITRARSAVQSRKTDLANALRDIRDSETELRRLTADKNWKANQFVEMIPVETPVTDGIDVELENVVFMALENRPEIKEMVTKAKIAGIQRDISVNDLLPELSFLMGTYVSALKGDSQLGQAIQDQFGEVTPGYSVGLEFEFPIGNRAARSRLAQRKLQLAKIRAEVDETMQNIIAESQVSLRRVTSAKETLDAAAQAINAANDDLEQNFRRWESFALIEGDITEGQTPTTVLDQLLDSQERLTAAELVYTQAELELKSAEVSLKRTMGTLLIHEKVTLGKALNGDVPELLIDKAN